MRMTKVCTQCGETKPEEAFHKERKKRSAWCADCKNACVRKRRGLVREAEMLAKEQEETVCPCDHCFKQTSCQAECVSFKTWSEHGV